MHTEKIPAPWNLKGEGYIVLYRFKKEFVESSAFIPKELKGAFRGGLGALMIVDYQESSAGGYQELLFIPGRFKKDKLKKYNISKIFVSTRISVENGIANWAIPKELASFRIEDKSKRTQSISVAQGEDKPFFEADISSFGIPFPLWTGLIPFPLMQPRKDKWILTRFSGWGFGKLARVRKIKADGRFFPNLEGIKPLLAVRVSPFHLTFPLADVRPMEEPITETV